jgi:hypothetical protein
MDTELTKERIRMLRRHSPFTWIAIISTTLIVQAQKDIKPPETFTANAQALGRNAGASAQVTIQINEYTSESDLTTIQEALRIGGYQGFLPALRSAPEVGYVEMNGRKVAVRWARQQPTDKGRTISIVTESPLAFVGGAAVDARPRKGYEVAVIRLDVDQIGLGTGSMAAAARVRPGGPTGVQIDDYAENPLKLVTVRKSFAKQ